MKKPHVLIIGTLLVLTFLLSACATGSRVSGAPGFAVSDDQFFVSYGNAVYALNTENGMVNWSFPEDAKGQIMFFAPPLISNGSLYVGDIGKNFSKINVTNGKLVWSFSEAKGYYIGQANEANGMVYAPNNDGKLYALDTDGNLQWAFETGHFLWSQPQIGEDAIYLGSMDKFVYAISLQGEQLWATEMAGAIVGSPILSEDGSKLFVGSIGNDFLALNTTDGSIDWSFIADGGIWSNALLTGETLNFADSLGNLYALDPLSGKEKQRFSLNEPVTGGLTAIPNGFALVTEAGTIEVFNEDGTTRWSAKISGKVFQAPAVNENYLIVAAVPENKDSNVVYAYNLATGAAVWSTIPKK